ncbi:lanthionine synthetase C family protein [Archangium sp.]|uniref:lanthionine synthetase C family protein n=1 Tax=Archangium sp. TaxID=1872627 RepID=UPI00286B7456|nr:lanthionine synthetase C family protein [Archangium sp.]
MVRIDEGSWRPLLEGGLAEQARQTIMDIVEALEAGEVEPARDDPSLAGGEPGLALFHSVMERVRPGEGHARRALECLERAFESVAALGRGPTLFTGYPGVGWVAEHLRGHLFDAEDDPARAVDEALEDALRAVPFPGEYELVHGLVGLGVYALERRTEPAGRRLLERVVTHLTHRAERDGDGAFWVTERRSAPGVKHVDLGMSHGVGGVVALLAAACRLGHQEARPLLAEAVSWVLARRQQDGGRSLFPGSWVPGTGPVRARAPNAWCYGAPGLSVALLSAARALGDERWERAALEIARGEAQATLGQEAVTEVGLCHGTAGLGHLHHLLHQATGEPLFAEAARTWFQRTLALRRPGGGLAGFSTRETFEGHACPERPAAPGLLQGVAGLALALVSAVYPVAPAWGRVLLLELPRSEG